MSADRPADALAEVFAGLGPLAAVTGGRMGGKQKALNEAIEKLIRAGWTEVTADPEYGGPRKGVRMFRAPGQDAAEASRGKREASANRSLYPD